METAKGYLKHERETLETVIQARNQAVGAAGRAATQSGAAAAMAGLATAEGALTGAMGKLFALAGMFDLQPAVLFAIVNPAEKEAVLVSF